MDRVAIKQKAIDAGECKASSVDVLCSSCVGRCSFVPDRPAAAEPMLPSEALPENWKVREAVNRKRGSVTHMVSDAAVGEIMSAVRDLMPVRTCTTAPVPASDKHLPGWERGIATVTMNGHQLREALEFIAPGPDAAPDEMDNELTFGIVQHAADDGKATTGLCCWNDDTDGVMPLDGQPSAAAAPVPETPIYQIANDHAPSGWSDVTREQFNAHTVTTWRKKRVLFAGPVESAGSASEPQ